MSAVYMKKRGYDESTLDMVHHVKLTLGSSSAQKNPVAAAMKKAYAETHLSNIEEGMLTNLVNQNTYLKIF